MRRFSFYKRNKIYYVRFYDPEIKRFTHGLSTRETSYQAAMAAVYHWEKYGLPGKKKKIENLLQDSAALNWLRNAHIDRPTVEKVVGILKDRNLIESAVIAGSGPANENFILFLKRFWDFDRSPYVREKLSYGHSIGRRHSYEQLQRLGHWETYFGETRIKDLSREKLRDFQLYLKDDKELAAKTCNLVFNAGSVALAWAAEHGIIENDPAQGLIKFSGKSKKRGILSIQESAKLFSIDWRDERSKIGNMLAATTGLRAGEVLALKWEDVKPDYVIVRHSWSRIDGLKGTKTGEERTVPLLPSVYNEINKLIKKNPFGESGFIFYSPDPAAPMSQNILRRGLEDGLGKAEIDIEDREIVFHSWRHFYASCVADRVDLRLLKTATGHATDRMAEHYSNHKTQENLKKVAAAVNDIFGNVIPFDKTLAG